MRRFVIYASIATSVAAALHLLASISWSWATLVAFVGWPLVGTLITLDDDLPGGFSNPDGAVKPEWLRAPFWAQISLGTAIAASVAAVEVGSSSAIGRCLGVCAVLAFGLAATLAFVVVRRSS